MSTPTSHKQHRRISLPIRISIGLVLAAILPLVVMLSLTHLQTRPALIDQANQAMASDAQTRVQLIDTYFEERVADALTLAQVPSVKQFLLLPPEIDPLTYQESATHARYSLQAGIYRDEHYRNWTLFDTAGQPLLNEPEDTPPQLHGDSEVPQHYLDRVLNGETFVSHVYGTQDGQEAIVDIYSAIQGIQTSENPNPGIIGFMRATLKLDYIWEEIVQKNLGNNGAGSYAFILDQDGIRIADTEASRRFTTTAPLPEDVLNQIVEEERFGDTSVSKLNDVALYNSITNDETSDTFQTDPTGQEERYQIVRQTTSNSYVRWHYFVLSPVNTVTALADTEMFYTFIVAAVASLIVAIIGLFAGRGIANPILRSIENLKHNSQILGTLANNQQAAASEQVWVVDSSQVGLQSVQYYTDASKVALHQLRETANDLLLSWRNRNVQQVEQRLENIVKATHYLENATEYQHASNQKLATALKVATQVTEQLHQGALSATEAASRLDEVVHQLLAVSGGK